jgi:hypothetical protein
MRRSLTWFAGVALLCIPSTPAFADNIVVNGGFETGDFTGWTVANGGFTFVSSAINTGGVGPHSGNFYAALGALGSPGGTLTQVLTTTPGQQYVLSYYLASDGGVPNGFGVEWNGTTVTGSTDIPQHGYQLNTFVVTATGSSTTLTFREFNSPGYLSLDDVSVAPPSTAPEPGSVALASMGAVCIGAYFAGRRRRAVPVH